MWSDLENKIGLRCYLDRKMLFGLVLEEGKKGRWVGESEREGT